MCTYPLDVAKTRLAAQRRTSRRDGSPRSPRSKTRASASETPDNPITKIRRAVSGPVPYQSTVDCLQRIAREEGLPQLYAGLRPACVKAFMTNFIFFYLLRALRPLLGKQPLLQGMGAGVGVQLIVMPVDMIVTRLQTARGNAVSFLRVVSGIIEREGLFGLWSGIGPGLLLTLNPGITQLVQTWLAPGPMRSIAPSALEAFWSGAASKAVASVVTYPYMRAKVQMQVQGMVSSSGAGRPSTLQIIGDVVGESGLLALFDGLMPQLINAVLKEALLNTTRLQIAGLVAWLFQNLRFVRAKRR